MQKTKKIISIIIVFTILIYSLLSIIIRSTSYAVTQSVSTDINGINTSKYPGIKDKIQSLKSRYPNWNFKILYTGIDWNEAIASEYTGHGSSPKNLVYKKSNYQGAWICPICGERDYDTGGWRCASIEAIKYMMDPRNSINSTDVFQFEELTNTGSDINILRTMTNGSFLSGHEQGIINAANSNNVNPYYIAARLIQEQGKNGTTVTLGTGYNGQYVGYYNAFNVAASGNSKETVLKNALAYAQKKGWTSLDASINGGISFIASQYIKKGQNTLYLQKFDVEATDGLYSNQYMQNILAAENEGLTLKNTYTNTNSFSSSHTFVIPVYENMPGSDSPRPSTTGSSTASLDNLVKVNVGSSLRLRDAPNGSGTKGWLYKDEVVTRLEKATSKVGGTYWDKVRKSDGTEGYAARQTYDNESSYKLYLVPMNESTSNTNNNNTQPSTSTKKGDASGDGKIDSTDLLQVKRYLIGKMNFSNEQKSICDVNGDGKIDSTDLLQIKKYLLGKIKTF